MPIDRVGNTKVEPKNPLPDNAHSSDRPLNAEGLEFARCGYQTLDRADPGSYFNRNRRGLSTPVEGEPNSDYGDETFASKVY